MTKSPHLTSISSSSAAWTNNKIESSSGDNYSVERCGDKLSAIIINFNTPEMTESAIRRLRAAEPAMEIEIILIDNASTNKLPEGLISSLGPKYIQNRENLGFAKAVNQGIGLAQGEYILLLNSDVLVETGAVGKLVSFLDSHPEAGAVGPRLVYPDGREQVSFGHFPNFWREFVRLSTLYKIIPYSTLTKENRFNRPLFQDGGAVDWLSGGCLLVRRAVIEKIGKLDEYYFFGVEDIDFCWRVRQAGFQIRYLPQAKAVHHHGFSSGGRPRTLKKMEMERANLNYFMAKHFPEAILSRWLINLLHRCKIGCFKVVEK